MNFAVEDATNMYNDVVYGYDDFEIFEASYGVNPESKFKLKFALASPFKSPSGGRRLVGDTGAADHMADPEDLTPEERRSIQNLDPPRNLAAVGGITKCHQMARAMYVQCLNLKLKTLLMKGCPTVLSIGRLCIEDIYAFWWPWKSTRPMLLDKDYNPIYFDVQDFVPMINDDPSENLAPDEDFISVCIACSLPGVGSAFESDPEIQNMEPSKREKLIAEAKSRLHQALHMPYNPFCEGCRRGKARFRQHRQIKPADRKPYTLFGEKVTGDVIRPTKDDSIGVGNITTAFLLRDLGTGHLHNDCLLYTSPSPRDGLLSRMPSSA